MVEIKESARKHGVSDGDMLHALRHYWRHFDTSDPAVALFVGPSLTGAPLEVAVVSRGGRAAIIHAMRARRKYPTGRRNR